MGKSEKEKSSRRKGVREAKRTRLDEASLWRALSTRDFNAFLLQVLHVARAPRAQPAFPPEFILFIVTTFGICTNEHFPSISNTLWSSGDPMTGRTRIIIPMFRWEMGVPERPAAPTHITLGDPKEQLWLQVQDPCYSVMWTALFWIITFGVCHFLKHGHIGTKMVQSSKVTVAIRAKLLFIPL